jgi:hypothetical protein
MFMLNGRFTKVFWESPYVETEGETCMILDHRYIDHHDGDGLLDELLIVTTEGEFCWVQMEHIEASPIEMKPMSFGPLVPDLPKIQ